MLEYKFNTNFIKCIELKLKAKNTKNSCNKIGWRSKDVKISLSLPYCCPPNLCSVEFDSLFK